VAPATSQAWVRRLVSVSVMEDSAPVGGMWLPTHMASRTQVDVGRRNSGLDVGVDPAPVVVEGVPGTATQPERHNRSCRHKDRPFGMRSISLMRQEEAGAEGMSQHFALNPAMCSHAATPSSSGFDAMGSILFFGPKSDREKYAFRAKGAVFHRDSSLCPVPCELHQPGNAPRARQCTNPLLRMQFGAAPPPRTPWGRPNSPRELAADQRGRNRGILEGIAGTERKKDSRALANKARRSSNT